MRKKRITVFMLTAILIIGSSVALCSAGDNASMSLTAVDKVYLEQEFDVEVELNDVENLEGVDFTLSFDSQLLEVKDADAATDGIQTMVGIFLQGLVVKNEADNQNGTIRFVTAMGDPGITGSGVLTTIKMKALQAGTAQLIFTSAKLIDKDLNYLVCTTETKNLSISDEGCISGFVKLQGRDAHEGIRILVDGTETVTTASDGSFSLPLSPGTYSLYAIYPHYLSKKLGQINITSGQEIVLDVKLLPAGDADSDDDVDLQDLAIVARDYDGSGELDADFNGDGKVDLLDLVLLAKNYNQVGDAKQ